MADAVVLVSAATWWRGCCSRASAPCAPAPAVGRGRLAITQVVLAAIAGWWGEPRTPADPPVFLPGSTDVFGLFVGLLVPTVVATFVVAWVAGRRAASWTRRLRWALTPAALLTTAYMLALTVLAGLVLSVAGLLGDAAGYREGVESAAIEYAQAFEVLARGVVVSASVALVTIAAAWLVRGTAAGTRGLARAEQDWAPMTGPDGWSDARASSAWLARVRRACRFPVASLASVEWGVWVTSVVAVTGALWYGVRWAEEMNRRDWSQQHIEVDIGWLEQVPLGLCTWLLTAVPLVAVLVLRRAIVSPSTRRSMAIAWDVSTFWPRSYHPLAPPSYAERAVPELQARLLRLWGGQDGAPGSVLLLGHSQGSVLVAAAIASLPHDTGDPLARRLGVVTYGSPIRRLYARHFPAYFTTGLMSRLFDRLREPGSEGVGWFNGYRDTDFVGHRITAEGDPDAAVDCYFVDPPHPFAPPGDSSPPVRAHSEGGYRRQGPFRARVASEATRLEPGGQDVSP